MYLQSVTVTRTYSSNMKSKRNYVYQMNAGFVNFISTSILSGCLAMHVISSARVKANVLDGLCGFQQAANVTDVLIGLFRFHSKTVILFTYHFFCSF